MVWKKLLLFVLTNEWLIHFWNSQKCDDKVIFQWLTQCIPWRWVHNHCWSLIYLFIKNYICLKAKNCFNDIFLRWYILHLDNLILLCFSSQKILVFLSYYINSIITKYQPPDYPLYDQTTYQNNNHTKMPSGQH